MSYIFKINPGMIFILLLLSYFLPFLLGLLFGRTRIVSLSKISEIGSKLADPLTIKLHKWSRKYKMACWRNEQWIYLFLLILLNNLLLTAFVTRILYGVIFFQPILLAAWTGFGHGVLFSKPEGRAGFILIFFEFGGYLFASVIGVKLGLGILHSIASSNPFIFHFPANYALPALVFLTMGAAIETLSLKMASRNIDLSEVDKIDLDQRRKEIAKSFDEDTWGKDDGMLQK
ncbi:MAG: hypothetical protein UMV23_07370 [Halanaerobium sp.]|nr:hypothetical protein [Halanaerobium sp.]